VYLPPGNWIDYQTSQSYAGGWHKIDAGKIPVVLLVRDGAVIPHIGLAQSTLQLDWSKLELISFAAKSASAKGFVSLPADNKLHEVVVNKTGNALKLVSNPLFGKVTWKLRAISEPAR
jgi:alpha-D-xyloside xylohydrolase